MPELPFGLDDLVDQIKFRVWPSIDLFQLSSKKLNNKLQERLLFAHLLVR